MTQKPPHGTLTAGSQVSITESSPLTSPQAPIASESTGSSDFSSDAAPRTQPVNTSNIEVIPAVPQSHNELVENLAQLKTKYELILEAQGAELRKDPVKLSETYERVMQPPNVVAPGQQWLPSASQKEAYMAEMDRRCNIVPMSFNDRMMISIAAHAAMTCVIFLYIAPQPRNIKLRILKRSTELHQAAMVEQGLFGQNNPLQVQSFMPEPAFKILQRPATTLLQHQITVDELKLFEHNPLKLVGKQFTLQNHPTERDGSGGVFYEVVQVGSLAGKGLWYEVRYEGSVSSVEVSSEEMMEMLKNSLLVYGGA